KNYIQKKNLHSFPTRRSSDLEPESRMKQELEQGLNQRLLVEEELKNARETLEEIENELKILEKERLILEESLEKNRNEIEQLKRSEEHTSELQSPYDLVCRLL